MPAETESTSETNGGQGVAVFQDPGHLRADARLVTRLLSLGVVDDERVKQLLVKGIELAENAAEAKDDRGYTRCMQVLLSAAKLEQDERKAVKSEGGNVTVNIQNNVANLTVDQRRAALSELCHQISDTGAVGQDRGTADGPIEGTNGHGKPPIP